MQNDSVSIMFFTEQSSNVLIYDRVANRLPAEMVCQTDVLFQFNVRKRAAMSQLDVCHQLLSYG